MYWAWPSSTPACYFFIFPIICQISIDPHYGGEGSKISKTFSPIFLPLPAILNTFHFPIFSPTFWGGHYIQQFQKYFLAISGNLEHFLFEADCFNPPLLDRGLVHQKSCDPFQIKFTNVLYAYLAWISSLGKFRYFPGWVSGRMGGWMGGWGIYF